MNNGPSPSIFLNGKAQVVEMLEYMTPDEKDRLINNIRLKNPALATELLESSLDFNQLSKLTDNELKILFNYIKAPVLGMALKNMNQNLQRRILSLSPRTYAEEAYSTLVTPIRNEKRDSKRAQNKIINIVVALNKQNKITLK